LVSTVNPAGSPVAWGCANRRDCWVVVVVRRCTECFTGDTERGYRVDGCTRCTRQPGNNEGLHPAVVDATCDSVHRSTASEKARSASTASARTVCCITWAVSGSALRTAQPAPHARIAERSTRGRKSVLNSAIQGGRRQVPETA
jgi:hypothetical protein